MATQGPAITPANLGAWLVKGNRDIYPVDELVRTGFASVTGWSLKETYRTELVEPDQPVLFWISGDDDVHPAGIYAQGYTSGPAERDVSDNEWIDHAERGKTKLFMPVRLEPVLEPVLRSALLDHPSLSQIEVMKMPAGSNPSFLAKSAFHELQRTWPQVTVG